jgi:hypothetical protein
MIAIVVALVVFLAFVGLLLGGAYMEMGRDLPCKRASLKQISITKPDASAQESQGDHSTPVKKVA